jgi:hypothetical protein
MERKICAVKMSSVFLIALLLYQVFAYGEIRGYKPADEPLGYDDNFLYKKWCEEMFDNGVFVYEGYKKIAFDVEYAPELPNTDYWQTPLETARIGKGDCEDAMLLFIDYLSYSQGDAKIVWGWIGKQINILYVEKAHVWVELIGRDGKKYVVEAFSKRWDGIIPVDQIEKVERRKVVFELSCSEFNKLNDMSAHRWNIQIDEKEILIFGMNNLIYGNGYLVSVPIFQQRSSDSIRFDDKTEIENIFKKLHSFFLRRNDGR